MFSDLKISLCFSIVPAFHGIIGLIIADFFTLFNCLLTIGTVFLFFLINKWLKLFSKKSFLFVLLFILFSVYGGRTLGAYHKIENWDKLLHFSSGFLLYQLGSEIFLKISKGKNMILRKLFSLFVALSGAGIWEIFEFACDKIFKTTAQNNSLSDTMVDIIMGTFGALISVFLIK